MSSAPPPMPPPRPEPLDYPARTSVLEKPRVYRLTDSALLIRPDPAGADGPPPLSETIPLRTVEAVRLRYFPTRVQTNRFECLVRLRSGRQLKIVNEEYRGLLDFTDRSAEYRGFVRALCTAVAAANPTARFATGRPWLPLVLEWGFLGSMLLLLAAVLWLVGGPAFQALVVVKLLLLAFYAPTLVRYARRNLPGAFDPRAVPETVLPAAPAPR